MQNHHYSLSEVENMMPWEREIYLFMLTEDMQRQREEQQKARMQQGRR